VTEPTSSQVLSDHQLIRRISGGSYGEVWLARSELGTYRALKIIQRTRFDSARPFEREFEGIKKFEPVSRSHDGFVDILHIGRGPDADSFYYVMELADDAVAGQDIDPQTYRPRTLASDVVLKGPIPIEECVRIGVQLCKTLGFLHDCGLIHRDVKPSNVIFVEDQPKLADIGLIAGIDEAKTFVGTTGFIAPEGPNSAQADIYSLGKLLYEISTGKDRNEFPTLPDRTSFSDRFLELNEVLVKACNTDITRRYRTAHDMAADLELIATGKSVRRLHYLEDKLASIRRFAVVLGIILAILGLVGYQIAQIRQRAREEKATLIGGKLAEGTGLLQEGDFLSALPFFLEVLKLNEANHVVSQADRLRIGSILAASPAIESVWHLPDRRINACALNSSLALVNVYQAYARVFDVHTGRALSPPIGTNVYPQMACFVPDGTAVVTGNWDGTMRIVDWKSGQTLQAFQHPNPVNAVGISADGQKLISGCGEGSVYVWDRQKASGRKIGQHSEQVRAAAFSPSGNLAVTASADGTARVWDPQAGTERFRFQHPTWVYDARFHPEEKILATACYDKYVRLWDLESGKEIRSSFRHESPVRAARFSPDGRLVLTACPDGVARIWMTETHQLVEANHTLHHGTKLVDGCFSQSGEQILTAGDNGTLTFWDFRKLPNHPYPAGRSVPEPQVGVLRSLDGMWQSSTNGNRLTIRNGQRSITISLNLLAELGPMQFNDQSTHLSVADGTNVHLVDLAQERTRVLDHPDKITCSRFSPDGRTLVCGSADKSLREMSAQLWSVATGRRISDPLQHDDGVLHLAFSPDSTRVITSSEDFTAIIWDARTGKQLTRKLRHHEKVRYAAFAETQDWVVTASEDSTAVVWDAKTGDQLTPPFRHAKPLVAAKFVDHDTALLTVDETGDQWKWPLFIDTRSFEELRSLVWPLAGQPDPKK
jgi:WD40 repeat protein/serine/threonine protein kinase